VGVEPSGSGSLGGLMATGAHHSGDSDIGGDSDMNNDDNDDDNEDWGDDAATTDNEIDHAAAAAAENESESDSGKNVGGKNGGERNGSFEFQSVSQESYGKNARMSQATDMLKFTDRASTGKLSNKGRTWHMLPATSSPRMLNPRVSVY